MDCAAGFDEDGVRERDDVKKSNQIRLAKERAGQDARRAHQNVRIALPSTH